MTVSPENFGYLLVQAWEANTCPGWRGRNERTGKEGIFPKSYVKPLDEKAGIYSPPPPTNYGNMPLAVAQSGSNPASNDPEQKSKFEENGKKFGKKLGNAGKSPSSG